MNLILWHDGKEAGPYNFETVRQYLQDGNLSLQMLARSETESQWKPLASFFPALGKEAAVRISPKKLALGISVFCAAILLTIVVVPRAGAFLKLNAAKRESERITKLRAEESDKLRPLITELRKLSSVTEAGVSLDEYSRRVLDAKVEFDRIASSPKILNADTRALRHILNGYVAAKEVWSSWLSGFGKEGLPNGLFYPAEWAIAMEFGAGPWENARPEGTVDVKDVRREVANIWATMRVEIQRAEESLARN